MMLRVRPARCCGAAVLQGVEVLSPCVFVYTDPVCACRAVRRVSGSDGGRGGDGGLAV